MGAGRDGCDSHGGMRPDMASGGGQCTRTQGDRVCSEFRKHSASRIMQVEVFAMSEWPEDPTLLKMVEGHMHLLEVLKEVWLFQVVTCSFALLSCLDEAGCEQVSPAGISSKNGRVQQSSVGTVLTSQIRNAFK